MALDVLMLAQNDWANTGWRFFKCLQSLGLNVIFFKGELHPFLYPEQGLIHPVLQNRRVGLFHDISGLAPIASQAKVIHYIASTFIDTHVDLNKKFVVMQHGGTAYRQHYDVINKACNPFVDAYIIQCPDLLGLGAKNEQWIYYPVDTNYLKPDFSRCDEKKLIIGHFPSNTDRENKGTKDIESVVMRLKGDPEIGEKFHYVGWNREVLPWAESLNRVRKCDVIVECMAMNDRNARTGEWGNTAIEAAALGKIVVTNSLTKGLYEKEYGELGLLIANDEDQLEKTLRDLILNSYQHQDLINKKMAMRLWVEQYHSMEATAKRIWDKVYRNFFEENKCHTE